MNSEQQRLQVGNPSLLRFHRGRHHFAIQRVQFRGETLYAGLTDSGLVSLATSKVEAFAELLSSKAEPGG